MSNTRKIVEGCIAQYSDRNQLAIPDSEIFEIFCGTQITKNINLSFEEILDSVVDGGNDGGIDLFINLINNEYVNSIEEVDEIKFNSLTTLKVIINQSKRETSFKESSIDKLLTTCPILFDLNIEEPSLLKRFNPDLVEKLLLFRKLWEKVIINGGRVFVDYNYSCLADSITVSAAFISKTDQLIQLTKEKIAGASVKYQCLSCSELLAKYQTQRPNRLELPFKENPISITYGNVGIGYVGAVRLQDYVNFIKGEDGIIREDLFESNIRHYQGEVDVNNKIRQTLESDLQRDFWWLNNGITIIASNPTQVAKKLYIENIQIVNGLQSTYTIGNFYQPLGDNDDRSVLVKVIINNDKETIDKIIASTNSQNAVSSTLLRATDAIQRNIEVYFLNEGYYYDRRKNYYKNLGKPITKIFSIQYAAQAILTILYFDPASARAKPTTLIKDDGIYNRIFNAHIDFKAYLKCCQLVQKAAELYSNITDPSRRATLTNFKLHLAWVLTTVVLNKIDYTANDLLAIDMSSITMADLDQACIVVVGAIENYQIENTNATITNIAKNKSFNDFLSSCISSELSKALIEKQKHLPENIFRQYREL